MALCICIAAGVAARREEKQANGRIGETPENAIPELLLVHQASPLAFGMAERKNRPVYSTSAHATGARLRNPSGSHHTTIRRPEPC
jgi:hypothetical protein